MGFIGINTGSFGKQDSASQGGTDFNRNLFILGGVIWCDTGEWWLYINHPYCPKWFVGKLWDDSNSPWLQTLSEIEHGHNFGYQHFWIDLRLKGWRCRHLVNRLVRKGMLLFHEIDAFQSSLKTNELQIIFPQKPSGDRTKETRNWNCYIWSKKQWTTTVSCRFPMISHGFPFIQSIAYLLIE